MAVGYGDNTIATSPNGVEWTGRGNSVFTTQGFGVAWNGAIWVAVGSGTNSIAVSSDGLTWTGLGTSIFSEGRGIAWNGTRWVAVGSGANTIAWSTDGITWTGNSGAVLSAYGHGVAWNGSIWVAVGWDGAGGTVATSSDGITWSQPFTGVFADGWNSVAWNGTLWVATGLDTTYGTLLYSTDGVIWSPGTGTIFDLEGYAAAWNGTLWLATGGSTLTLLQSSDGVYWSSTSVPFFNGRALAWNGSLWVLGRIYDGSYSLSTSPDGTTWTDRILAGTMGGVFGLASRRLLPFIGETIAPPPIVVNPASNRVLTANGTSTTTVQAQSNLTFDGTTFVVNGGGIQVGVGSSNAPTYTFQASTNTGLYYGSDSNDSFIGFTVNGTTPDPYSGGVAPVYINKNGFGVGKTADFGYIFDIFQNNVNGGLRAVADGEAFMAFRGRPTYDPISNAAELIFRHGGNPGGMGIFTTETVLPITFMHSSAIKQSIYGDRTEFTTPIRVLNGDGVTPSYSFSNSTNTGMYYVTGGSLFFAANGTSTLGVFSNKVVTYAALGVARGTPTYTLHLGDDSAAKQSTSTWTVWSDQRIKQNIEVADVSLCYSIVKSLKLKRFTWDPSYIPTIDDRSSVGWIAQDVKQIFPKAVNIQSNEFFSDFHHLNVDQIYKTMYGALTKVIEDKEALEAKYEALLARVVALEGKP